MIDRRDIKQRKIRKDRTRRKVSGRKIGDGGRGKIRGQRKRKRGWRGVSVWVREGVKGKRGKEVGWGELGGIAGCFGLSDG